MNPSPPGVSAPPVSAVSVLPLPPDPEFPFMYSVLNTVALNANLDPK